MKVCLLNNLFPPVPSGSSFFTFDFARKFAARGHDVTVITVRHLPELPEVENLEGLTVYRLPCFFLPPMRIAHNFRWMSYSFTPSNVKRIKKILQEREIQVIHQNGQIFDLALSSVLVKKQLKIPGVITIHANALHNNPFFDRILEFGDKQFINRFIIRHFEHVVAPDVNYRDYCIRRYGREDTHVVPYGVDYPVKTSEPEQDLVKKYDLGTRPFIVSLGHIHENRNRMDLIEAMPTVLKKFPKALLMIIGEQYYKRPIELVKELKLEKSVVFTGALPREKALGLVEIADAQALWCNRSKAGLGIASLEAMSLGVPMVSTVRNDLIPGVILESGKHLMEITKNDPDNIAAALVKLLQDQGMRKHIGKFGKQFVIDHYTWDAVCDKMEQIFNQAIEKK